MAKKKTVKKQEVEIEGRFMSDLEMMKLDNVNKSAKIKSLEILVAQLKLKITNLQFNDDIARKNDELAREKEVVRKFNEELKAKYDINTDTWGYDPLTGEIRDE